MSDPHMIAVIPVQLMREIIYDYWSKVKDDPVRYNTWYLLMPIEELCDKDPEGSFEVRLHA